MARLNRIWRCKQVQTLQVSCHLHPPLRLWHMDPASWLWKKAKTVETKCMWKLLRNSYSEHETNDWVRSKINFLEGTHEPLPATIKRRKLAWFGHVTHHDRLSKTILQGTMEGGRRRGRHKKCWKENIKEWTSLPMPELLTRASCKKDWKRISAEWPNRSRDWTELNWGRYRRNAESRP